MLKDWLFEHALAPYPRDDVKQELMQQSGLSLAQLNNWCGIGLHASTSPCCLTEDAWSQHVLCCCVDGG